MTVKLYSIYPIYMNIYDQWSTATGSSMVFNRNFLKSSVIIKTKWYFLSTCYHQYQLLYTSLGFPVGSVVSNQPASAGVPGDTGLIPGSGRSPGEGNNNTPVFLPGKFHWQRNLAATVNGITRSWIQLSNWACMHTSFNYITKLRIVYEK